MDSLTERLEIRLPARTLDLLRSEAKRRNISVAQLLREAIHLLEENLEEDRQARLRAAEKLFLVGAPVADWPKMKRQIEEGRLKGKPQ